MTRRKRFSVIAALVAALMSTSGVYAYQELREYVEAAALKVGGHDGESCLTGH